MVVTGLNSTELKNSEVWAGWVFGSRFIPEKKDLILNFGAEREEVGQ